MLEVTSPEAEESGGFDYAASYANSELAEAAIAMVAKLRCAGGVEWDGCVAKSVHCLWVPTAPI